MIHLCLPGRPVRRPLPTILLAVSLAVAAHGQTTPPADPPAPTPREATPATAESRHLPADVTTQHALELPDRTLRFSAAAGAIRLADDKGAPRADVAFIAYRLDGADPRTRPVTFVFNGGPGMASGWLQVGAVGPWRIRLGADASVPSASPDPLPNAETWLDFTDLVFIDPPGTGYSRILAAGEEARRSLWSVDGDIAALAEVIRRWLDRNERIVSPKFLLGESYGGFRAPRLARVLQSDQGVGVAGLVLVSPALEIGGSGRGFDPFRWVARLPSMAAASRAAQGRIAADALTDVEQYASTDYLLDLLRGVRDAAAVARMSEHVAALTGLAPSVVARYRGRIDSDVFLHEFRRAEGRIASAYDATITRADPFPHAASSDYADPVLDGLKAPVSSAMVAIYTDRLHWYPENAYHLASDEIFRQWQWGRGLARPEAVSQLQTALALDPRLRVLIAHGMFDLVTPYFATRLLLDQMPAFAGPDRMRLAIYPGGHMFYTDDASRAALREASRAIIEQR
jgi:carboxypeptidase C (cathepsin A)